MKKIILFSILFFPLIAGAQPACDNKMLSEITKDFQRELNTFVNTLNTGTAHSPDFRANAIFWEPADIRARERMPADMYRTFQEYQSTFETLDKIYAHKENEGNVKLAEYHACQTEFFIRELYGALWDKSFGLSDSGCDQFITLNQSNELSEELSEHNLAVCRGNSGTDLSATDGSNLGKSDSSDTVATSPGKLDFNLSQFRLTANEIDVATRAIEPIEGSALNEPEESLNWFARTFQNFFGKRKAEFSNQDGQLRTANVVGTREIDAQIQVRRSVWENSRNYWLRRGQKSGEQLDRYDERLSVKIFEVLKSIDDSLQASLDTIENVCLRQKTITNCWEGPTYPRNDLRSPKDTFNSEDGSGEEGIESESDFLGV